MYHGQRTLILFLHLSPWISTFGFMGIPDGFDNTRINQIVLVR